jgi:hypothetical protein
MRWHACMLREFNLVGCFYIDIFIYRDGACHLQLLFLKNMNRHNNINQCLNLLCEG